MANYEALLRQDVVSTAYKTAGALWCNTVANTQRRIQVYEVEMGQFGSYATTDAPVQWDMSRFSATNLLTATAVVPNSLDPADVSPLSVYQNNATTELTVTTAGFGLNLKNWGINQRGSYRWRALDDGDNLIIASTAGQGIVTRVQSITSGYNQSATGNISFIER